MEQAWQAQDVCGRDSLLRVRIVDSARLLGQLLLRDVERPVAGVRLKQEKSTRAASYRCMTPRLATAVRVAASVDGHKASVAVLLGKALDARGALELVDQSEENMGLPVTEVTADAANGDGRRRRAFVHSERMLWGRAPKRSTQSRFSRAYFVIDLEQLSCTCLANQAKLIAKPRSRSPRYNINCKAIVCDTCSLQPQGVADAVGQ